MTGTTWIEESGQLEGPVMLTNTHSVGVVRDATIAWRIRQGGPDASGYYWSLPVVAETWDGHLNDINGFHVKPEHVDAALDGASGGPVAEGNVGGGTGMVCYDFKCGIGTASRMVEVLGETYTVGVLVQANYGLRDELRIAGVPVGRELVEHRVYSRARPGRLPAPARSSSSSRPTRRCCRTSSNASPGAPRSGSPELGSVADNGSGDIFVAFSTADAVVGRQRPSADPSLGAQRRARRRCSAPPFEATEEAIVNAMVAARDMVGDQGRYAKALPHQEFMEVMSRFTEALTKNRAARCLAARWRRPIRSVVSAPSELDPDVELESARLHPEGGNECFALVEHHGLEPVGGGAVDQVEKLKIDLQRDVASEVEPLADAEIPEILEAVPPGVARRRHDRRPGCRWSVIGTAGCRAGRSGD